MKTEKAIGMAVAIGNDYGQLIHFEQLPMFATAKDQTVALQLDINMAHQQYKNEVDEINDLIELIKEGG